MEVATAEEEEHEEVDLSVALPPSMALTKLRTAKTVEALISSIVTRLGRNEKVTMLVNQRDGTQTHTMHTRQNSNISGTM